MPLFHDVIYNNLLEHTENLTRVRIKIDPAQWSDDVDVTTLDEYVGYILQEFDDGTVDIFVPDQGFDNPIMRVLQSQLTGGEAQRYELLKKNVLEQIPTKGGDTEDIKLKLSQTQCIHDIVSLMKMNNFADSEIIDQLKEYISETEDNKQF